MYEIAICDDRDLDRIFLRDRIMECAENYAEVHINEFDSGVSLLSAMGDISFAVIFLDIQMDGMDGEEAAIKIREKDSNVILLFFTGFAEPSPRSFEVQPFRYIMKSMSVSQINEYINATLSRMVENTKRPTLLANVKKGQLVIKLEDIIYIEKYQKSVRVHITKAACAKSGVQTEDGEMPIIRLQERLETIYAKIKKYGFGYPHDSYVVNLDKLVYCTGDSLKLEEVDIYFRIARSKAKEFNEQKNRHMSSKYAGGQGSL